MDRAKHFAIIGGGIGGLSLAIALHKKGFTSTVYEAAKSISPIGAGLGLAGNAVKAFEKIGISTEVLKAGSVLKRVSIKDKQGKVLAKTDSEKLSTKYNIVNNFTIHRADLHDVLLKQLYKDRVQLDKVVVDFIQSDSGVQILFKDGSDAIADYVIACDGIHSVLRRKALPLSKPRYAGYTCWRAVINNPPPTVDMSETSETWGPGKRFGIAPLSNGRLYWFACINAKENNALLRSYRTRDLLAQFVDFHSPISEIIKRTRDDQLIWNDIIDIKPLKKFAFGKMVLMGDAAHATTPNMGQGACMAIEDAAVLANEIENCSSGEEAFISFEKKRIQRTTTIVKNSWQLGRVAQLENYWLIGIRNSLLRLTPPSVAERQVKFLQEISF